MNPFEYANDLMTKESYDSEIKDRKDYKKFLINRSLSYQMDLIYIVNEINKFTDIDNKTHYDFLYNIIPKIKYGKALKASKENIELVKEFFKYSDSKASTALSVLTEGDIEYIKNKLNKGGLS